MYTQESVLLEVYSFTFPRILDPFIVFCVLLSFLLDSLFV